MKDLTELEICKRIAMIEGKYDELLGKQASYNARLVNVQERANITRWFNPLSDNGKGLWADLILKYEVSISFNLCLISMITNKQYEMNFSDIPSLKRKSLLLIIESHKDV